jgi:hypothetical protein
MIAIADLAAGTVVTITTAKGSVTGTFISVNSKGANVKTDDGRVVSRSLAAITRVDLVADDTDTPDDVADLFADGDTYGAAAIAAALDMNAYDLRVILRDLGYGVGKGSRYAFDAGDATNVYRAVKNYMATQVTADDTTSA